MIPVPWESQATAVMYALIVLVLAVGWWNGK